jgi:spermidine/putrescine transport system permease protein
VERPVRSDLPGVGADPPPRRGKGGRVGQRLAPYLLLTPSGLWQLLFFIVPMFAMLSLSLQSGNSRSGFSFTWQFSNYSDSVSQYSQYFLRSFRNATIVTIAGLVIAYPVAYWIAFYAGKRKSTYLLLVLLPFLVSFVIRTLAWKFILSDDGIILGPLKNLGLLSVDFHVLATTFAVVAGITYNLLPFTVLPLFVSLDRIDKRLVEAAGDLYSSKAQAFWKVVFPLSLPGVFAAVLLTFIPAIGDYLNAELLGGTSSTMIGTIINSQFLTYRNYPVAAALAFIVMALMVVGATLYARLLGTEEITT